MHKHDLGLICPSSEKFQVTKTCLLKNRGCKSRFRSVEPGFYLPAKILVTHSLNSYQHRKN